MYFFYLRVDGLITRGGGGVLYPGELITESIFFLHVDRLIARGCVCGGGGGGGGGGGRCISVGGSYIRGAYNRMYFLFTEGLISRGGAYKR